MSDSLFDRIVSEAEDIFEPIVDAIGDPSMYEGLLKSLGVAGNDAAAGGILAALRPLADLKSEIATIAAEGSPSFADIAHVLKSMRDAFAAAEAMDSSSGPSSSLGGFAKDLIRWLIVAWLSQKYTLLYDLLVLLTIVEPPGNAQPTATIADGSAFRRSPVFLPEFHFERISPLLSNPGTVLRAAYVNGLSTTADANAMADVLFPRLANVLTDLGIPRVYGLNASERALLGDDAAALIDHSLLIYLQSLGEGAAVDGGVTLALSAADHGDLGLVVTPFGGVSYTAQSGNWTIVSSLTADVAAFAYGKHGATIVASAGNAQVDVSLAALLAAPDSGPAFVFGSSDGSRLEVGGAKLSFDATLTEAAQTFGIDAEVSKSSIIIAGGDGDGFVSSLIPKDGLRADFELGVLWSNAAGLSFHGAAGLDATIPLNVSIAGTFLIPAAHIALHASDTDLSLEISASVGLALGPLQVLIDRLGVLALFDYSSGSGSAGVGDFSVAFKPPSGAGITIDSAGVSGGGFLEYVPARREYQGMLQLSYQAFQLQAFGLIATKLPTGPGYSLVAMIDATFPPIELLAGFTLNGIGGLLGVNRTVSTDALEAGIKAKTLSNFLFSKNPIANAPQLLTDLATFFPAAEGSYVFGPLLQIGWGTPTLVTINMALLLQLPAPVRLVLIGEIDVLLPVPDAPVVEMHMDVLGTIDFTADEGSLDAQLHDSRLVRFALHGAMAMRACWAGSSKEFLLSVGGFNPAFQPPASFPTLDRVSINMASGHITKLNLAGYLAVTSNTLQVGAHLDLFVGVDGFGIAGYLNFDTLIQFQPFHFDADISGGVTLSADGDNVMSLALSASMSGPTPWHVAGKVHFSILWFDVTKSFSATFGDPGTDQPTQQVDVGAALRAALADPRNFAATLTTNQNGLVSLRTPVTTGVALGHPAATLTIDQRIVPLGLTIAKFGADAPLGDTQFNITAATVDAATVTINPVSDQFAPAQFLNLSDDDALSSPSFEAFPSGVSVAGSVTVGPATQTTVYIWRSIAYETYLIDTPGGEPREMTGVTAVPPNRFGGIVSALANSGSLRYAAPSQPVVRKPINYVVATTAQITVSQVGVATGQPYAQARTALAGALAQNPDQRGTLQIVPLYEVPTS